MWFSFLILILKQRKMYNSIEFYLICFYRLFHYSSHLFSVWTIFHFVVFLFFYYLKKSSWQIYPMNVYLFFFVLQFKACSFILYDDKMLKIVWIALKWHEVGEQDVAGCSCCCRLFFFHFFSAWTLQILDKSRNIKKYIRNNQLCSSTWIGELWMETNLAK